MNEAFAAQVIPCARALEIPREKLNVHGGAIASGTFGMTGARLVTTLLTVLGEHGGRLGLATLCVGGGQGMALVVRAALSGRRPDGLVVGVLRGPVCWVSGWRSTSSGRSGRPADWPSSASSPGGSWRAGDACARRQLALIAVFAWLGALATLAGSSRSRLHPDRVCAARRRPASCGFRPRSCAGRPRHDDGPRAAAPLVPHRSGRVPVPGEALCRICRRRVEFQRHGDITLRLDVHRRRGHEGAGPSGLRPRGRLGHRASDKQGLPLMQHLAAHGWCASRSTTASARARHSRSPRRREARPRLGARPAEELAPTRPSSPSPATRRGAPRVPGGADAEPAEYQPGFESGDTSVNACVGFYGIYDFLDRAASWRTTA